MPASFPGTNVLVYLASGDVTKADRAEGTIAASGVIGMSVSDKINAQPSIWPSTAI